MSKRTIIAGVVFLLFLLACLIWEIGMIRLDYSECLKVGHSSLYCLLRLGK